MDIVDPTKKMVVSPRARRRVLEVKLKEKNQELRELCIREAELIGVLPPETPIEPGESPPSFTPKNTLFMRAMENSLKHASTTTKDEDLASLEQECRKQSGIAEAAFGLANDVSISKSLRRKHRLMYQHSQHRIAELETRINLVKRTSNLDLKKIKPVSVYQSIHDSREDRVGVPVQSLDEVDQPHSLVADNSSMLHYQRSCAPPVPKHQIQWGGHYNHPDSIHPLNQSSNSHKPLIPHKHINSNYLPTMYPSPSHDVLKTEHVYNKVSPAVNNSNIVIPSSKPININTLYHHHHQSPHIHDFQTQGDFKRFGSLDRRRVNYNPIPPPRPPHKQDTEDSLSTPALKPMKSSLEPDTVLLPNQMYPENNIMRAQSLINVRSSDTQLPLPPRLSVPWYELSSDPPPPPDNLNMNTVDNMTYQTSPNTPSATIPEPDVIVPYESPKNQTVVQVGKFQPYREISKPFEMSDFYKYSTKFRRKASDPATNTNPKANSNNLNTNAMAKETSEQNSVSSYNEIESVQDLPLPNEDTNDVGWIQTEKSSSSHASTFV